MPLAEGRRLGPYVVLAPIASGGMGVVYRARDTKLDRDVALKVLPAEVAASPAALSRFEAEAKAAAALSHPGILAVHDFGRIDGVTFAVAELLEGETLRAAVARGPLPLGRALDVASQVADALATAHESGLVHRDLKPENVFLTRDGRVKILDFGLAVHSGAGNGPARAEETPTDPVLGLTGGTSGTAAYMSPEHARGLAVGAASDQFSLGVVLYEMLSGVRPFRGSSSVEVLTSVLKDAPRPLGELVPDVPDPVRWIVERCLGKAPGERYASTRDLAFDLRASAEHLRSGTLPLKLAGFPRRPVRWMAGAVALVLLALAVAAVRRAATGRDSDEYRSLLAGRHVERITDRSMNTRAPALSPSGHEIAFVKRLSPSNTDVFVQHLKGGRPVNVTGDHPGEDGEPAFSPDGSLLAFHSDRDGGGLFVVESDGGDPRRLSTFGHDPAWLPDGRRVVFATTATGTPYGRLGTRSELWTVDLATGVTTRIYQGDAMQPAVSPGGFRVAFWALRENGARRDLATISLGSAGPSPTPLFVTDDDACDWSPFWSNDGRYLWFGSDRGGTMNLWRVRVDEASGEPLAPPEPVPVPARSAGPFRGTADGRGVVYQAGTSGFDLESVPLDARGFPSGRARALVVDSEGMGEPRLSPSGDLVAFSSWRGGEDLWVVGKDGRGLRRVTAGPYRDRSPSFSADGKSLVFHSDRSGRFEIWKVLLDGSGLAPLTRRADLQPFRGLASPDGRFLALHSSHAGAVLLPAALPPGAGWPDPLPAPAEGVRFEVTSFSPDGRLVAGHGIAGDETYRGTWVYDLAGRRYERLTAEGSGPQFAFDGKRVYFLRQRTLFAPSTVAFLDLGSRVQHEILPEGRETTAVALAAARDGSALYLVRERGRADIWLMTSR